MTFERTPGGVAEPAPPVSARNAIPGGDDGGPTPVQIRLQILTTEHWSLIAARGLAWNESFTRAGMFLTTLTGTLVALGLIGGIDHFGDAFFVFALVILPVELFIGLGTWSRMGAANYHDAQAVIGMNRIRGSYLEIAPDLEPYFVMGTHDDPAGVQVTMAVPPGMPVVLHLLAATPTLVVLLNAVIAGSIVAVVLVRFAALGTGVTVAISLFVAVVVLVAQFAVARRAIRSGQADVRPMFPTPAAADRPEA